MNSPLNDNSHSLPGEPLEFSSFNEALKLSEYTPAPASWYLVLVDIRNSTKAIAEGKYKEVNSVAGACVMGVINATGDVPYAFGGDGVTFLLDPKKAKIAAQTLAATRSMARDAFGFELAVGKVPIKDLQDRGFDVSMATLKLSSKQRQSLFSGTGIAEAERWIKCPKLGPKYTVEDLKQGEGVTVDYSGLECRWSPLKALRGTALTVIASCPFPEERAQQVYFSFMQNLESLFGGSLPSPIRDENMEMSRKFGNYGTESRIRAFKRSRFARLVYQSVAYGITQLAVFLWEIWGTKGGKKYREEVITHSDFRKFDGSLRMVIDISNEHADRVTEMLEQYFQAGDLAYGLHRSDHLLLTCMIFDRANGKHFHLVDGGNGGYTLASVDLKQRLEKLQLSLNATG